MGGIRSYQFRTIKIKNFLVTVTHGTLQPNIDMDAGIIFGGISTGQMGNEMTAGCIGFPQQEMMVIITDWLTHTEATTRRIDMTSNMTWG